MDILFLILGLFIFFVRVFAYKTFEEIFICVSLFLNILLGATGKLKLICQHLSNSYDLTIIAHCYTKVWTYDFFVEINKSISCRWMIRFQCLRFVHKIKRKTSV